MLEDELRYLLRELLDTTGAAGAAVVHERPPIADRARVTPLGQGAFLRLHLGTTPCERTAEECAAAMERSARALRACARRWEISKIPELELWRADTSPPVDRINHRITTFLQALSNTQNAVGAIVTLHGRVVASCGNLEEIHWESVPFTIRRVAGEATRRRRSHGELVGDDYYAVSFWFGACLVAFFSGPYAVDFFRHRTRLVLRELSQLLPMLDDPPPEPANLAPIPE